MEQRLEDVFKSCGLCEAKIEEARLHKKENSLEVRVRCVRLVRARMVDALEKQLCCLMPGCAVEVSLICDEAKLWLENGDPKLMDVLRDSWCDILPVVRPAIIGSIWSFCDGKVQVRVPEKLFPIVDKAQYVRTAEEYYFTVFGLQIKINLISDSSMEAALTHRQEEVPEMQPAAQEKKIPQKKKAIRLM